MGERYVLAVDCGTQSARALLFNEDGHLFAKEKVEFKPYVSPHHGWAEQDPELYWKSIGKACLALKESHPDEWAKVEGAALTTQRDTVVNLAENGEVLRPAIIWLDQRMAKCEKPLPIFDRIKFKVVGMEQTVEIIRRESKANWIKENQPEIWSRTHKYLLLSGYLSYKFTGRMVDSTACQIGHIPFDSKNFRWPKSNHDYRWKVLGVEREKLPELVEPGGVLGRITKEAAEFTGIKEGLPLIASGSDKGCETLGMGCMGLDAVNLSFGTSSTVQMMSDRYIEPIRFLPAYPASIPGFYNPEIQIRRGFWMVSWYKQEFAAKESAEAEARGIPPEILLDEMLKQIPPGSDGLILQPYWGAGLKMPEAKGAIIGFGDVHTRAHIYRAIIEGINYGLLEGVKRLERKSRTTVKQIMVSGGGAQSDVICQITADMFNRPVYRGMTFETSGLGAAINAFVGLGVYNSYPEAIKKMVNYSTVFYPDEENSLRYMKLYDQVYRKLYPRLKSLYKDLQEIN